MDHMPGNAPQPGETPHQDSNPWPFSDPDNAFWRGDADREPEGAVAAEAATALPRNPRRIAAGPAATLLPPSYAAGERKYTGEPAAAHASGGRDARAELAGHDQVDDESFEHLREYATTTPDRAAGPEPVHSPELDPPDRNRQTVAFDRGAEPDRPTVGLSRQLVNQPRPPSPLLENSPFWLTDEQRAAEPPAGSRDQQAGVGVAPRRRPRTPRRPATGLFGLVALALIAAFFAWVSAEPFWLAVGHGDSGLATVGRCTGDGVSQRCVGRFQAGDGAYAVDRVTLLGVEPGQRNPGALEPARMVSESSRQAYVGEAGWLVQLRWLLGFLLVVLCGLGIAGLTGARRLETGRARRGAILTSLTGPLLLLAGFLYVAY